MKFAGFTLALAGIFTGSALAQTPTVGGLLNNYSFTLPGLPNYGIAQGSIFDIFGTNLSSTSTPLQNPPLQSTLDGVTITVTVNGTVTNPLIYFLSPTQIAAVLPSATPVGTGTLTVANSGGTSTAFPIQVVQSAFGLLTSNNGTGPVQGFDANNSYAFLGYSASANPGDILELWGTGLGPTPNDATAVAVSNSVEVDIGGVPAKVIYAGRSSYIGLDQINVTVPSGITGCNVSVVVVTGNYVSNFGTTSIAASGRTCSDATSPITTAILNDITKTGTFTIGVIGLTKTTTPGITVGGITVGGGTTDGGFGIFEKVTGTQLNSGAYASAFSSTSIGSCVVTTYQASSTNPAPPTKLPTFTSLNAGSVIDIVGPDGTTPMNLETLGSLNAYTTASGTSSPSFIPASGGSFTFNNGTGGPDVGAFTAQLQLPAPLVWTNMGSISTVTRSSGLPINWTGGDPSTYVTITGYSAGTVAGSTTEFVGGFFSCQAPTAPGTFTVPAAVLLSLPPSLTIAGIAIAGSLSVDNYTNPVSFTAPNIDYAFVEASFNSSISVTYQ